MKHCSLIILLLGSITICKGQPTMLGIEDVIRLTLENSFDIKISDLNKDIAGNNAVAGEAGYLPTVDFAASYNYSSSDTKTEFANPDQPPIDASGAVTEATNASLNLNYNIYSGGQRKFTFRKLNNQSYQSQIQLRQSIEQAILSVLSQFLSAANQKASLEINKEALDISFDRYERAKENYNVGVFNRLELLNAEVDLRNDSTTLFQSQLDYEKALKDLVNTIGLDPGQQYKLDGSFNFSRNLDVQSLLNEAMQNNASILFSKANKTGADLDLQIAKSNWMPRLNLSGGYAFNRQDFEANFLSSTRDLGWDAGLSLSYNIFDGGSRTRQEQNAVVRQDIQQANIEKAKNQVKTSILNAFNDFETNLGLIPMISRNVRAAAINYERSKEAFNQGQITGVALREAQLNLLNARYQLEARRIQTKIAEVNLHFYSGRLVGDQQDN